MNQKDYFKDIYNDFFGVEKHTESEIHIEKTSSNKDEKLSKYYSEIDNLHLEDASILLLKQIIEYMRKYQEGIEKTYISFNIVLKTKNKQTINTIIDMLYDAGSFFNYINNNKMNLSLYHLDTDLKDLFNDSSYLSLEDLNGLDLLDLNQKKKFFYELENHLLNKQQIITIISGSKDEVDKFFNEKSDLLRNYFSFIINDRNPEIQDIYNEITTKVELNDDLKIKVLDYITNTYSKIDDYRIYKDNLIKELSFNKSLPLIVQDKSLTDIFKELEELVGLTKVKKVLYDLVDLIELKKKSNDLKINNPNLHMVFLGNPGTGKTTVARIVASALYNLNYIKENKLIEVSSKDLVAEYVGQTAPKTNAVIEKSLGGVLFIDEAYSLASMGNDNSYNAEAIATLIQAMENHRDELVVIFAGYTKEMQNFLNSNSGIVSRIGYTLEFEDYTEEELIKIFNNFMTKAGFIVTPEADNVLRTIINENKNTKNFGNARFIRNIYEKTIIKHAGNTKSSNDNNILKTITKEDISTDNLLS